MRNFDSDYFFQHKLIPCAFFSDKEKFLSMISKNGRESLYSAISGVYEKNGIEDMPYVPEQFDAEVYKCPENDVTDEDIFIAELTFPAPEEQALCARMFLIFDSPLLNMMCFTVEKRREGEDEFQLGGWLPDGKYISYTTCRLENDDAINKALGVFFSLLQD